MEFVESQGPLFFLAYIFGAFWKLEPPASLFILLNLMALKQIHTVD